jgi:hypothetical protein
MHHAQTIYGITPTSADAIVQSVQVLLITTAVNMLPTPHMYGMPCASHTLAYLSTQRRADADSGSMLSASCNTTPA